MTLKLLVIKKYVVMYISFVKIFFGFQAYNLMIIRKKGQINMNNLSKITEVQMQLIINSNLYKKKIIDESTFSQANEKLLKMLKVLKTA